MFDSLLKYFFNERTLIKFKIHFVTKGGCDTQRKHRAESWYFSREAVTVQGGNCALFAVMVQVLLSITSVTG